MIGQGMIFLFVFVLALLGSYMSRESLKHGNTVNTEYLNRTPNLESRIPNWSECTAHLRLEYGTLFCLLGFLQLANSLFAIDKNTFNLKGFMNPCMVLIY